MSFGGASKLQSNGLDTKLASVVAERIKSALGRTYEFLDSSRWASAHDKGLAHVRLIGAVEWLLGLVAFTREAMDDRFAVLREQRARIGFVDWITQPAGAAHITVPDYLVAAAVVGWQDEGPDMESLREAVRIVEAWRASQGGLEPVLSDLPRDGGWQRLLAAKFVREFVCRAALGDWEGVAMLHAAGFRYLDAMTSPSAAGLLIVYCVRLAELVRGPSDTAEARCRDSLRQCMHSWRLSVAADDVWDTSLTLLYLCAWTFEHAIGHRSPSVRSVGETLLGMAADAGASD